MTGIKVGDKIGFKGDGSQRREDISRIVTAVGEVKLLYVRTSPECGWYEHSAFMDQVEVIE